MSGQRVAVYLDLENLLHPFRLAGQWSEGIQMVASLLRRLGGTGTLISAIGVCDPTARRHVAFPMNDLGVRVFTHDGGPDAADLVLVKHIRGALPASAGTVVIASGDHLFAPVAMDLRAGGRRVIAVALRGTLSHELYRSVDDAQVLPYGLPMAA